MSPKEDKLNAVLQGQEEPGALLREFYATTGKRRRSWLSALDTRSFDQLAALRRMADEYGTASGVEFKDAIIDILDMRRSQGRTPSRDPSRKKSAKFERCVKAVKKSRSAANPWAVCHTSLGKKARRDPPVKLDKFTHAYLVAALWSSYDHSDESGGEPLDQNYSISDFAPPVLKALVQEAREFEVGYEALWMGRADDEQAGHDFWLTRNGHGAGFWDRPELYGKREAEQLTKASNKYGEVDLYVGDDGQIWAGGYEKGTRGGR